MILNAGVNMVVGTDAYVPVVLMLRPQGGQGQNVLSAQVQLEPYADIAEYTDLYGNLCQRVVLSPGETTITSMCSVDAPDTIDVAPEAGFTLVQDLPENTLIYLLQSRYCESDMMLSMAANITRKAQPGYDQVEAIRKHIHRRIKYKYGVSDASTSAMGTAKRRAGVCRDYAHLGIALCRALRIPARMVVGYLYQLEPMDLHAWFEAFVGGRWYTFDATQKEPRGNRIVIAYGRDAADVAQLSQYGPMEMLNQNVWVNAAI